MAGPAKRCYLFDMSILAAKRRALGAPFILQDRKRLPVRFFGAYSGTKLSRLS